MSFYYQVIEYFKERGIAEEVFMSSSSKEYFLANPIQNMIGLILGPILYILLIRLLSMKKEDKYLTSIKEGVIFGGMLAVMILLSAIIPCILGATIELTFDIAVGVCLTVFFFILWDDIILIPFSLLLYAVFIYLGLRGI